MRGFIESGGRALSNAVRSLYQIVDLEVPRSSRGGGTSHFNGLAGQSELIASQKPDWEAYGKQRRDFPGAALRISSSSPATREDAAGALMRRPNSLFSAPRPLSAAVAQITVPPSPLAAHGRADVGGYLCRAACAGTRPPLHARDSARPSGRSRPRRMALTRPKAETNGLDAP
jgi:hypothetical protein